MHTKWLRLCFEAKPGTHIESADDFRALADFYMKPLGGEYAGYITLDPSLREFSGAEPVWQYMIREHSAEQRESVAEIGHSSIPGYRVVVFEKTQDSGNELVLEI